MKVRTKEKLKNDIEQYENHYNSHIAFWEQKLSNLGDDKQFNPISAFKGSITYSFIFSILVMLVIGFATYTSSYSEEPAQ